MTPKQAKQYHTAIRAAKRYREWRLYALARAQIYLARAIRKGKT